jgi:hypothetical protein
MKNPNPLIPPLQIIERAEVKAASNIVVHQEVWMNNELVHSFHGPTAHRSAVELFLILQARPHHASPPAFVPSAEQPALL